MINVNIEISQGSSISPILFLIYTRYTLSQRSSAGERIMSYINNIKLVILSKSIEENYQIL